MEERVAITGLGVVTAAGMGIEPLRHALELGSIPFSDETIAPGVTRKIGRVGEISPISIKLQSSKASQIDAVSRYAVEACAQALKATQLELNDEIRDRTGVLLGSAYGCLEANVLFDQYYRADDNRLMNVSPLLFKSTVSNAAAGWVSILLKLRGINATFVSGRIASAEAIGHGFDLVRDNIADMVLAGGMDRILPINLLLDTPPAVTPAEGAGIIALESMSRAVARGATVLGRLHGYTRRLFKDGDETRLVAETVRELMIPTSQIGAIISSRGDMAGVEALRSGLGQHLGISPTIWPMKAILGECYAAFAGIAIAATCLRLDNFPPRNGTVLVIVAEPDQEAICLAVRRAGPSPS